MKNLFYLGIAAIALATIGFVSCEKEELKNDEVTVEQTNASTDDENSMEKATWPPTIGIDLPFEPIRLARAISTENHAGRICGCNECFGLCNRPLGANPGGGNPGGYDGVAGIIGIHKISETNATVFILNNLPPNFEEEFGVDEPVTFRRGKSVYTIKPGVYNAIQEEGTAIDPNGDTHQYFVKVNVELL